MKRLSALLLALLLLISMVGCGNDTPTVSDVSDISSVVTTTSTTVDAQAGATPQASEEMANATATQDGSGGSQAGNKTPATSNLPSSSTVLGSTPSSSATPSGSSAAGQQGTDKSSATTPSTSVTTTTKKATTTANVTVTEDGIYDSYQEVGLYIHLYGKLPKNYVKKSQYNKERDLCVGGDRFYNKEGLLPSGQTYYECDIDTLGKTSRGAKRLVWTKSGIVYYTSDHYASFTQLYGAR